MLRASQRALLLGAGGTVLVALLPGMAWARNADSSFQEDDPPTSEGGDPGVTLTVSDPPAQSSFTAPSPDSATELPRIMPSRLSLGMRSGYGSPLGPLSFAAEYYPVSWFGIEAAMAPNAFGEPTTLGEAVLFQWPQASWLEQGLGIGLAHSFVPDAGPTGHGGVVHYLTADCGHLTFYFSRALSLRVSVDLAFPLDGADYCTAHPDACPRAFPIGGSGTLLWSFDLSGGST